MCLGDSIADCHHLGVGATGIRRAEARDAGHVLCAPDSLYDKELASPHRGYGHGPEALIQDQGGGQG